MRPETAPAVVLPDFVAVFRTRSGEPVIAHAEFESRYDQTVPGNMARYGGSLSWQHLMPVESTLVLLRPEGTPAVVPEIGHYDIGPTHTSHPYRVVKLWQIDPAPVLATHNPNLLPWALLMKSSDEQVREIASIVASQGNDEAVSRFLHLGSIRYDRGTLIEMLGGARMGLVKAFVDGSSFIREARVEGRAEGRVEEARRFLLMTLRAKCPDLEHLLEIDQMSNIEKLEALAESILFASDADSMRSAIITAAVKPN